MSTRVAVVAIRAIYHLQFDACTFTCSVVAKHYRALVPALALPARTPTAIVAAVLAVTIRIAGVIDANPLAGTALVLTTRLTLPDKGPDFWKRRVTEEARVGLVLEAAVPALAVNQAHIRDNFVAARVIDASVCGAYDTIVAIGQRVFVNATSLRIAGVDCAFVLQLAVEAIAWQTSSGQVARLRSVADVVVVANKGNPNLATQFFIAGLQASAYVAVVAFRDGVRVHLAYRWSFQSAAEQCAVADVSIFERFAVLVLIAQAVLDDQLVLGQRRMGTFAAEADILVTRVSVVTIAFVRRRPGRQDLLTNLLNSADVCRTWILIIAVTAVALVLLAGGPTILAVAEVFAVGLAGRFFCFLVTVVPLFADPTRVSTGVVAAFLPVRTLRQTTLVLGETDILITTRTAITIALHKLAFTNTVFAFQQIRTQPAVAAAAVIAAILALTLWNAGTLASLAYVVVGATREARPAAAVITALHIGAIGQTTLSLIASFVLTTTKSAARFLMVLTGANSVVTEGVVLASGRTFSAAAVNSALFAVALPVATVVRGFAAHLPIFTASVATLLVLADAGGAGRVAFFNLVEASFTRE